MVCRVNVCFLHVICKVSGVSRIAASRAFWTLLAACGIWLWSAIPCVALTWYWGAHPDKERLVVVLDGPVESYGLERTGRQALTLTLPAQAGGTKVNAGTLRQEPGSRALGGAKLLGRPSGKGRTVTIPTRTAAFGYISTTVSGNKIVVDLFPDPIGARWKPPVAPAAPKTSPAPAAKPAAQAKTGATAGATGNASAPVQPQKAASPAAVATAPAAPSPPPKLESPGTRSLAPALPPPLFEASISDPAVMPGSGSAASQGTSPVMEGGTGGAEGAAEEQAMRAGGGGERSYFSVPYTFRSRINRGGPEAWDEPVRASAPAPVMADLPPASGSASSQNSSGQNASGPNGDMDRSAMSAAEREARDREERERLERERMEQQARAAEQRRRPEAAAVRGEAGQAGQPEQSEQAEQAEQAARAERQAQADAGGQQQAAPAPASTLPAPVPSPEPSTVPSTVSSGQQPGPATGEDTLAAGGGAGGPVEGTENGYAVRSRVAAPGEVVTLRRAADGVSAFSDVSGTGAEMPATDSAVRQQAGEGTAAPAAQMPVQGSGQVAGQMPDQMPGQMQTSAIPALQPVTEVAPAQPAPSGQGEGEASRFVVSNQAPPLPEYPTLKQNLEGEPAITPPSAIPAPAASPAPPVAEAVPPQQLQQVVSNVPEPPAPKVVYVDKEGNPVPPPPDPKDLIFRAQAALNNGEAASALEQFAALKAMRNLTDEQRSEVLNGIADATYAMGKDDLLANYDKIIQSSTEAMNFDLKGPSVPGHLLRIGLTNMKIGNTREAEAYFNILRSNHPNSDLIPMTYYYWGDHYFNNGEWQKAADNYQHVVQNFPDSQFVREAGVGLARALYSLGFYEQAYQIVDYVEKRWPRFYVEYPPFLSQMGDVAYRMKEFEKARITYWTYYNIDPDGDDADMVLARLGDLYLEQKEVDAAREVYEEAARKFPERDGGLISFMRLAEEGVYDSPNIADMFSVFDRPYNLRPLQIYSRIMDEHPQSALAPLAHLKKAIWYLWNKEYPDALATASSFLQQHPGHELTDRVKEVALKAFNVLVADNIKEGNYERILHTWDQFPIVRGQDTELAPESRVALGLSYWKKEQPSKALEVIDPFFQGLKVPEYSEMALNLALSVYLDNERWADIVTLARRIEQWELNPESQRQLGYALALAHENLGEHDKASPMWAKLTDEKDMPREKEAYTLYFLSREAERKADWETAYNQAKQALAGFRELAKKDPAKADEQKIKDLLGSLMDITERTMRIRESLDWAQEYATRVAPSDPDYPGLQYRIAGLYRKNAELDKWRSIMTQLRDQNPNSLYGRMAASELRTYDLTEGASQFSPTGRL